MTERRRPAGRRHGEPGRASGNGNGPAGPHDRLEYMSDLILQLKQMAERSGLNELAGALAVAHKVARHEIKGR